MAHAGNILLVDDEKNVLWPLKQALEGEGYAVATAQEVTEALALVKEQAFHLIISDLHMEPLSGLDLLRTLRKDGHTIPLVIMTAFGSLDTAVEAMRLQAADYLVKPVESSKLLEVVQRLVPQSSKDKEAMVPTNIATLQVEGPLKIGIDHEKRFVAEKPSISVMRDFLQNAWVDEDLSPSAKHDTILATLEAAANAIVHSQGKSFLLSYALRASQGGAPTAAESHPLAKELCVAISDNGVGFEGEVEIPPGGFVERKRGLFIIKSLMDIVDVISTPGKGTKVNMIKKLTCEGSHAQKER